MKRLLILPVLLIFAGAVLASDTPRAIEPGSCPDRLADRPAGESAQPIAVLVTTNPWAMVIGADSPRLALYSDGQVIYRRGQEYRAVRLDVRDADELRRSLGIETLACFIGDYGDTSITDQPENYLFIGRGGRMSRISIYGRIQSSSTPPQVVPAYERLISFDHPGSQPWLPEQIEVMVWPYEYAPDRSIQWPSSWPDLNSETTVRRGNSYSIYLPSSLHPRLIDLLRRQPQRGAVEINGRKWAVSLRFPFPHEAAWMRVDSE